MHPADNKDIIDAMKIIAQRNPKEAQAMAVRLITQHDEEQFKNRVKTAVFFAGACLVGMVIWFLI